MFNKILRSNAAEQATGCVQSDSVLKFQDKGGYVSLSEAVKRLWSNEEVAVPCAGAGSYMEVFQLLGFFEVKAIQTGSSAGDWTFAVKDDLGWRLAYQENRYPYHGFKYAIDMEQYVGYERFEDLVRDLENENRI